MNPLSAQQLTGRDATHIRDVPELGSRLHADAVEPAKALHEAAAKDGIDLVIASSFRDFERQLGIWNAKFRGERPVLDRQGRPLEVANLDERARVDSILLW